MSKPQTKEEFIKAQVQAALKEAEAKAEAAWKEEQKAVKLKTAHEAFGFDSARDFVLALISANHLRGFEKKEEGEAKAPKTAKKRNMPPKAPLDDAKKAEIKKLAKEGKTWNEVLKITNVHHKALSKFLGDEKISLKK